MTGVSRRTASERIAEAARARCGLNLLPDEVCELAQLISLWHEFETEFQGFREEFHASLDTRDARRGTSESGDHVTLFIPARRRPAPLMPGAPTQPWCCEDSNEP
jgi:hypothetical protein